jgi:hypothetical protein
MEKREKQKANDGGEKTKAVEFGRGKKKSMGHRAECIA